MAKKVKIETMIKRLQETQKKGIDELSSREVNYYIFWGAPPEMKVIKT